MLQSFGRIRFVARVGSFSIMHDSKLMLPNLGLGKDWSPSMLASLINPIDLVVEVQTRLGSNTKSSNEFKNWKTKWQKISKSKMHKSLQTTM